MNWLIFPLISATFAAFVNYIDKYLVDKYIKNRGVGSIVIFASLISLPIMLILRILKPDVAFINPVNAVIIIISGMTYVLWLLPYLYALYEGEASVVSPLFQMVPVFSFLLGYLFLKEELTANQFIGSVLIFCGALGLNLEVSLENKIRLKKKILMLMTLSSFLAALNFFLFKLVAVQEAFWTTVFWEYIGFLIMAIVLFTCIKSYRKEFLDVFRKNKKGVLGLNFLNEATNMVSKTALNYATLLAPLAIVSFAAEGFQPIIVLGLGIVLTIFFPKIIKENIEGKYLFRKVISILIIILGTLIMYFNG